MQLWNFENLNVLSFIVDGVSAIPKKMDLFPSDLRKYLSLAKYICDSFSLEKNTVIITKTSSLHFKSLPERSEGGKKYPTRNLWRKEAKKVENILVRDLRKHLSLAKYI